MNKLKNNDDNIAWVIPISIILIIVSIGIYIYILKDEEWAKDSSDFGVFGDYIGGVIGTIVGFISVAYIYITYKGQVAISKNQNSFQRKQQFESTFFSLLDVQRSIILNLKGVVYPKTESSSDYQYITDLKEDLSRRLEELKYEPADLENKKSNPLKIHIHSIYEGLFQAHAAQLGHYFRHLYHLLKYIDDSWDKEEEKKKYYDIVQAQMSHDELYITAINGISCYGRKKMLPLLNDSGFLENLGIVDDPLLRQLIEIFYPKTKLKDIRNIRQNIIFVGGAYGVQKNEIIDKLVGEHSSIKRYDNSYVLNERIKEESVHSFSDYDEFMSSMRDEIDIDEKYIMQGHFVLLDEKFDLEKQKISNFMDINPKLLILLSDSLDRIFERLEVNIKENIDKEKLEILIKEEEENAKSIAEELGVPLIELSISNTDENKEILKNALMDFLKS